MSDKWTPSEENRNTHGWIFAGLITGLVLALAGMGFLWSRVNHLNDQLAAQTAQMTALENGTQAQISKLSDATSALLEQRLATLNDALGTAMKGAQARMSGLNAALTKAKSASEQQAEDLRAQLQQQQQQVTGEITSLKDATASNDTKIDQVSTDVSSVKSAAASTQEGLEKTTAELKRAIGDMGTMSGLIATNSDELKILRALGERNYVEFDINKKQGLQKVGGVAVVLRSSDPKHNRYTIDVVADDQKVQKSNKTANEPVQFYTSKSKQPFELVVNQVKKDEIVGYLSVPKVLVATK
jgi:ABC-type transporter Mla subunit MlaD